MIFFVPLPEYAPDRCNYHNPDFGTGGVTALAKNCVPKEVINGDGPAQVVYAPFPSMEPYSGTLTDVCQGAFAVLSISGDINLFAGDAHKLYRLTLSSTAWSNVTKTSADYSVNSADYWSFTSFSDTVIACQLAYAVQSYDLGSSTLFDDLATAAPRAKYCAAVKDFLMLGYTLDSTDGTRPQRIWWSGIGDPTNWPTPGTATAAEVQSDFQDIPGDHGAITGIVSATSHADAVVIFEHGIAVLQYAGGNVVWDINQVEGSKGTQAPKSIVAVGQQVYFYSDDGFRMFDGSTTYPIGYTRVDATFVADIAPSNIGKIVGVYDSASRCIIWIYPGSQAAGSGIPDTALVYNVDLDKWSALALPSTQYIFRGNTFGVTLEDLDSYGTLEDVPYSLDSPVWVNNRQILAGFDGTNAMNYYQGQPMLPQVETAHFQIGNGNQIPIDSRIMVKNSRPAFTGVGASSTVQIGHRESLNQNMTYEAAVMTNSDGLSNQRCSGRYVTARLAITSGQWTNLVGVEIEAEPMGRR